MHTMLLFENDHVFPLHALNKSKNIISDFSWTFWKLQNLIPGEKNQSVLIAKKLVPAKHK